MTLKDKIINLVFGFVLLLGGILCVISLYNFPLEKLEFNLAGFTIVTVFFSSLLQLQLPRAKIHFTISDSLLFVAILVYGGEVAVILSALESLYSSLSFRYKGINIKSKTIATNCGISVISTFFTSLVIQLAFPQKVDFLSSLKLEYLISVLSVMVVAQFLVNSVLIAGFESLKSGKSFNVVWQDLCFTSLIMYVAGAIFAGFMIEALKQIDLILFLVTIVVAAIVYLFYRRYVTDIKKTAALAENAERQRAEQAEKHVAELEKYIVEQEKSRQALHHAAFHDHLTDLPNRTYFSQEVKFLLEKSKTNPDFRFAVLFLDLNRFKTVNDSLGHELGDKLIVNVGKRLSQIIRKDDLVSRFSGDEFAILLNGISSDVNEVKRYAEMIQRKLSVPFTVTGRQVFSGASIGIAISESRYEEAQEILRDADIAMYYAKEKGEGYAIFDEAMHRRAVNLLQLETDLRYAIVREEFCLFYQPIIELNSMELLGFEALIRWNHPKRGLVPPYEFIPVTEETGLILPITMWVLRTACEQTKKWQNLSPENRNLMVSVNLSGKHFSQPDLVEQIWKILKETDYNPSKLKLEITESAVMENAETAVLILKELKELGIKTSIDDFGTGYSSLSYLHRFPIDTLKIDRSFVNSMSDASGNGEIVRTILTLAETLGLEVIAEGIETIHQLHQLHILGCQLGQGYLFSRPVSFEEAGKILDDKNQWKHIVVSQNLNTSANYQFSQLRVIG